MNKILVILENGLQGCCVNYTASQLIMFTKDWFNPKLEINFEIIDIAEDEWIADDLANFAYRHLKSKVFPLVYLNDKLIDFGKFPEASECIEYIANPEYLDETKIMLKIKEIQE